MQAVRPSKADETYLATLYGKALDARRPAPILNDTFADAAVRNMDFDFSQLKVPRDADISLPVRAKHLDGWTRAFLGAYPSATVLHLGCGLDTRVFRLDPPDSVQWFDVDLPDVIRMRQQLYPTRPSYQMIAASVTDAAWLAAIPQDQPVVVVAEGLSMYLTEAEGMALCKRLSDTFPSGEIIFDAYSSLMNTGVMLMAKFTGMRPQLRWGLNDPQEVVRRVPRLMVQDAVPFFSLPELVAHMARNPWQKLTFAVLKHVGFMQRAVVHVRYRF